MSQLCQALFFGKLYFSFNWLQITSLIYLYSYRINARLLFEKKLVFFVGYSIRIVKGMGIIPLLLGEIILNAANKRAGAALFLFLPTQHTFKYASLLTISDVPQTGLSRLNLHLGIFDQPGKTTFLTGSLDSIHTAASGSPDHNGKRGAVQGQPCSGFALQPGRWKG